MPLALERGRARRFAVVRADAAVADNLEKHEPVEPAAPKPTAADLLPPPPSPRTAFRKRYGVVYDTQGPRLRLGVLWAVSVSIWVSSPARCTTAWSASEPTREARSSAL